MALTLRATSLPGNIEKLRVSFARLPGNQIWLHRNVVDVQKEPILAPAQPRGPAAQGLSPEPQGIALSPQPGLPRLHGPRCSVQAVVPTF